MAENSKIQWTTHTWNPWVGCVKVSPGCKFCYAEELMTRKPNWANTWGPQLTTTRKRTSEANWQKPLQWQRRAEKENARYKVFCGSLCDVFEDNAFLVTKRIDLFDLIRRTPNLDWQLLTKRPDVARHFFRLRRDLLTANIWIGTSVEDQQRADERIPELLKIPASIRFLSVEPMLEEIDIDQFGPGINWVIIGGESGRNARPFDLVWAWTLMDYCQVEDIPVFMKQVGSNPVYDGKPQKFNDKKGGDPEEWPMLATRQFPQVSMQNV